MKHWKYLRKTLSFLLAFISASVFVSQGLVFDAGKVDAAVDSFKLFGVGTGLTAKEFVDNIGRYAKNMSISLPAGPQKERAHLHRSPRRIIGGAISSTIRSRLQLSR